MVKPDPRLAAIDAIDAELGRRKLIHFVRAAWHVVEPATPFVDNWHIGLVCEYLQALMDLEINNLIINIPPRHMKSLLTSVFLPAWSWIRQPGLRWLTGSYAQPLATRDAVRTRRLLQSPWYRQWYGASFNLAGDQNRKQRFENDRGGARVTFSFNSAFTGEGADVLVVDDPLRAQDADNPAARQRVNETYQQALTTRANDPAAVRRVIIMQRLHQQDLTGMLLHTQPGVYQHLCLPAEYSPALFVPLAGRPDPRTQPGELLWPQRMGASQLAQTRQNLGQRAYAGQYLQTPQAEGGNIFKAHWWQGRNRYNPANNQQVVARWISWDTAYKEGDGNDSSAMVVLELLPTYQLRLRHALWGRFAFPRLAREIEEQAGAWNQDGLLRGVLVEDKASGISALQTLAHSAPPWLAARLVAISPGGRGKAQRARQASLWCERGMILLPQPEESVAWLYPFEEWLAMFPGAELNDPADALVQGILHLENLLAEGWRASQASTRIGL